jgi:hypothetical protein
MSFVIYNTENNAVLSCNLVQYVEFETLRDTVLNVPVQLSQLFMLAIHSFRRSVLELLALALST